MGAYEIMKNKIFIMWIVIILSVFGIIMFFINYKSPNQSQDVVKNIKNPFTANATIKLKDLTVNADINKTKDGTATIKIIEPASLKDMLFQYNGDNIKIGYKGISVNLDENSKLVSSIISMIVNSIDTAASQSGIDVNIEDTALIISAKSNAGHFKLKIDRENGSIASISLPELEFECNFNEFIFV